LSHALSYNYWIKIGKEIKMLGKGKIFAKEKV
jgi:hypothetical protein